MVIRFAIEECSDKQALVLTPVLAKGEGEISNVEVHVPDFVIGEHDDVETANQSGNIPFVIRGYDNGAHLEVQCTCYPCNICVDHLSAPSDDDQDFSDDNDLWQDGSIDNGLYEDPICIEKLVKTMEAAVKETIGRGVAHPGKIAICGHSFGGFMTSVLLVHAPHLFCCGVARSGAYNRTLTPFGYQEYKTLWEATSSYLDMSTILSADKLKKPILLIHGQEDGNAGTWPMQFLRFFELLRGNDVECRLVILTLEGHGYIARKSVSTRLMGDGLVISEIL
ncbi:hypothetical protein OROMI_007435 [Orobanche minor]